ncbi:MAG TPA: thiamine pyrophosphate-binding protein, partial [Acidimicrobiales bacterium]|nr:thiamine pyrophosphate-binding protein [Acidimicrobiales bacterium]
MATGNEILFEVLATEGVEHVFGNPGSTELPFIDALADHPEIGYVLALQEATAVAMADGYAQVTRRPAFVNLHTSAGLGNAVGNLTNARANGTPLVITAGNADRRHLVADPLLSGDLVGLARGTVKWGAEVHRADDLGVVLRRAFRDASTPPTGPVFVSIPMDVLDEPGGTTPPRSPRPEPAIAGGLDELAALLVDGGEGDVAIVAGEAIASAGALDEITALAERLVAPVFGAPLYSALVFPTDHALWRGMLNPRADAIASTLSSYRRVLVVGDQAFLVYPYSEGSPVPATTEVLHLAA